MQLKKLKPDKRDIKYLIGAVFILVGTVCLQSGRDGGFLALLGFGLILWRMVQEVFMRGNEGAQETKDN
jgi:hypothetical protein